MCQITIIKVREQETLNLNDSLILKTSDANARSLCPVLATGKMQNYSHSFDFVQHNRIEYGQPGAALVRVTSSVTGNLVYFYITNIHCLILVYRSEVRTAPRS